MKTPYCFHPVRAFLLHYHGDDVALALAVEDGWRVLVDGHILMRSIELVRGFPKMEIPIVAASLQEATDLACASRVSTEIA